MSEPGGQQEANLWSLAYYDKLRRTATQVTRNEGSNIDLVSVEDETAIDPQVVPVCHMDIMIGYGSTSNSFDYTSVIAMAAHHLNTGDGRFAPALEGLPDRCPIRFTLEATNSEDNAGVALDNMRELIRGRSEVNYTQSLPAPCAILGDTFSSVTTLSAPVSGVFEIPQVSASATSARLDDKSIYKLFGRTIPSDNGIAVTILQFLSNVLKARYFNVVHQNDAFPNALVKSLRDNIPKYAPGMIMHQVVYNPDSPTGAKEAVQRLKESRYRHTFCFVWNEEEALYTEAHVQGLAGDGLNQWFFVGDTVSDKLIEQHYQPNSPLYDFFQGVGAIEVSGGEPGMPTFDQLTIELATITQESANEEYITNILSSVYTPKELQDSNFMQGQSLSAYSIFWYDVVVSLGLAACNAYKADTKILRGVDHFEAFRGLSFQGASGFVRLDNETGSRDPTSAYYRLLNYRREPVNETFSSFQPTTSYAYVNGVWVIEDPYVFNDGTTDFPIDIGPLPVNEDNFLDNTYAVVGIAIAFVAVLVVIYLIVRELKRKADDMLWRILKEDLDFSDPPQVLGHGTYGKVLLAEYRGTEVAVKQIIEQQSITNGSVNASSQKVGMTSNRYTGASSSSNGYKVIGSIPMSKTSTSENESNSGSDEESGLRSQRYMNKRNNKNQKKITEDFMEEMRQLSLLRHPNVTTVMGAVVDNQFPMLVMEYMPMGSLYDVIHNPTIHLDGDTILDILSDITQGMRFLHKSDPPVIHGDLKAQNVLIDSYFRAKVADFGLSQKTETLGGTGTPFWMAPELLREESANTSASDVFSFGVLMFEVCTRQEPYEGENGKDVIAAIKNKVIKKRVTIPSHLSEKVRSVMMDCMDENPAARATFDEIGTRLGRLDSKSFESALLKKKERPLRELVPEYVAKAFDQGERVENERKENVSIFACTIAGLEGILKQMQPFKVTRLMERLETNLRVLAKKHGVFLLETDGNFFMAASNVARDQALDHAARMVRFASDVCLDNKTLIDDTDPENEARVCVQAGIHVGTVTIGMVGNRNQRFSLFGEDVLIATMLAKESRLGMINCSKVAGEVIEQQDKHVAFQLRMREDTCLVLRSCTRVETFWVSRKNQGATDALERVRAGQRLRCLKHSMEKNVDKLDAFDEKDHSEADMN